MRLAVCANITQATCARAPQNLRPCAGDEVRIRHASRLGKKTLQTCSGKHFLLLKKIQ